MKTQIVAQQFPSKAALDAARVKPPVTALNSTGRSKIVHAIRACAENIGRSGTLVSQVCAAAMSVAGGVALSATDTDAIMSEVARSAYVQGMKPQTRKTVLSRWRTVLAVYSKLPEAEKLLRSRLGTASWHQVMTLAVRLKGNHGDVPAAVKSVFNAAEKKNEPAEIKTKADAIKAARTRIKAVLKLPRLDRDFLRKLNALCVEFEIFTAK